MQLLNDNGRTYEIVKLENFNEVDANYYNGEWQKFRYGLLKSDYQIVVASMVGETSWGQGYYFDADEMPRAEEYYNKLVAEYRG